MYVSLIISIQVTADKGTEKKKKKIKKHLIQFIKDNMCLCVLYDYKCTDLVLSDIVEFD